jgi:hypothetical protein
MHARIKANIKRYLEERKQERASMSADERQAACAM